MIKEITVPDIGQFENVEIIEMSVQEGQSIKKEEALITLETEKASMDVPCPFDGTIKELKVKVGDKVSQGSLIALIEMMENEVTQEVSKVEQKPDTRASSDEIVSQTIKIPDLGSEQAVEVIEVAIQAGDKIKQDDPLITLESEKASMDVPSPFTGVIEKVLLKVGDKVTQGSDIAIVQIPSTSNQTKAQEAPQRQAITKPSNQQPSKALETKAVSESVTSSSVHAGPATRRLARECGVDLAKVTGTGRKQRILTEDVYQHIKQIMQNPATAGSGLSIEKAPEIDFSKFGEIEIKPLNRIKKWTAKNLHRNWVTIPHVTQFDEADITDLEIFRQENKDAAMAQGIKLTPLAFIIKAVVSGLKVYPEFNASLASNQVDLILKKYFHIGIAVDTPNGLVVPVLRDCNSKGIFEIAKELGELSELAREGKLKNDQMQGSCFSITSLGGIGGTAFTPIINAPDIAILGLSKAAIKPVYQDKQFVPRRMLPLSLSYDHRVIDGAQAAKFTSFLTQQLQDIRKLLL